jgi:3-hydroxybutyrate dehydrogenase
MMTVKGKTAIVTGSTSGIGHGIARAFAGAGIGVVLNGFGDAAEIEKLRAGIEAEFKVKATYSNADMTKPAEIHAMVAAAAAAHGSVDILVNNAGIQYTAPVVDFPEERWDQIIAINLSAAFHAAKAALPFMKKAGWGRVINIASAHGLVGSPNKAAYVAAKHGIVGLTKVIAIEHANDGITANAICPGWVLTPLVEKQIGDRAKANGTSAEQEKIALVAEKQPMHEFVSTEQLGGLALFLVSDAAATMTGASLSIDGGWTAE